MAAYIFDLEMALRFLDKLGYTVNKSDTFTYQREGGKRKAFYVIEKDTGLGFANVDARRDDKYNKLQKFRRFVEVRQGTTICEF